MLKIRLAAPLQSDSILDGEGIRTIVWTQGCAHNCPFCHNPETHSFKGGYLEDIETLKKQFKELKGQTGIFSSDIKLLENQLDEKIALLSKTSDMSKITEYKKQISDLVSKKAKLSG